MNKNKIDLFTFVYYIYKDSSVSLVKSNQSFLSCASVLCTFASAILLSHWTKDTCLLRYTDCLHSIKKTYWAVQSWWALQAGKYEFQYKRISVSNSGSLLQFSPVGIAAWSRDLISLAMHMYAYCGCINMYIFVRNSMIFCAVGVFPSYLSLV